MKITEEMLIDYVMGDLDGTHARAIEVAAAADPALTAELAAWHEVLAGVAESAPPVAPSPGRRQALLDAMPPVPRLTRWAQALATFLDVTLERAQGYLQQMSDPATWEAAPFPGMLAFHVEGGPRVTFANGEIGMIRLPGGVDFPYHEHGEHEASLVLQGAVRFSDGTVARAGDTVTIEGGSGHSFQTLSGPDLIYALVLVGGHTFVPPPEGA